MPRLPVNLATEPFVNRAVPLGVMGALAALAVILTVANIGLFALFGGEYRKLRSATVKQQQRLAVLGAEIKDHRAQISSPEVSTFVGEATFLDGVLRAKAFSWTLFLTRLEDVKAYGIMFGTVSPSVDREGRISVALRGTANPREEILKFENSLFASRFFRNATLRGEQKDPQNPWTQFDLAVDYSPEGFAPEPLPPPYPPPPYPPPAADAPAANAPETNAAAQAAPPPPGGAASTPTTKSPAAGISPAQVAPKQPRASQQSAPTSAVRPAAAAGGARAPAGSAAPPPSGRPPGAPSSGVVRRPGAPRPGMPDTRSRPEGEGGASAPQPAPKSPPPGAEGDEE